MPVWPIDWPLNVDITAEDPFHVQVAEQAAGDSLRMLTLYRVGGLPITVKPQVNTCAAPFRSTFGPAQVGHSYLPFWPVLLANGAYANCFCGYACGCDFRASVKLAVPVGRIDSVKVNGVELPTTAYQVENGDTLVRLDGDGWPACAWDDEFLVTYLNAYEVDVLGQMAGGMLAAEFLKALTNPSNCRLPKGVTQVARQGMQFTIERGLFPDGVTNIPLVDAYIAKWNPNKLKTRPMVYSPDLPPHRTVSWEF